MTETTQIDGMPIAFVRGPGTRALVIVPSAFGVTEDMRAQMRELAHSAALVATLNPFWREHPDPLPYSDFAGVMRRLRALDGERLMDDARTLTRWAAEQASSVLSLGICFGGAFAVRLAAEGLVDAVATWHAGRLEQNLAYLESAKVPMALHFGGADRVVPAAAIEQVRAVVAERDDVVFVVHPGADHGFTHPSAPPYDAVATESAKNDVRVLLTR